MVSRVRSVLLLLTVLTIGARPAIAASADEIRQRLEASGYEVLDIADTSFRDRPAFAAKIMRKGGNSNSAFAVDTQLFDGETGRPISRFQRDGIGYSLPPVQPGVQETPTGETMRGPSLAPTPRTGL